MSWLRELAEVSHDLPRVHPRKLYYSHPVPDEQRAPHEGLPLIVQSVRSLIQEDLFSDQLFDDAFGPLCIRSGHFDDKAFSWPERELEQRVGKPELWESAPETWSEEDLYQFIEVFHDLASRPTRTTTTWRNDPYCRRHPAAPDPHSGRILYRWRINRLLATTPLMFRLANDGEQVGRMVPFRSPESEHLVTDVLIDPSRSHDTVAGAIARFQNRSANIEEKRAAVKELGTALYERQSRLESKLKGDTKEHLQRIASGLREGSRNIAQYSGSHSEEFLEWVFYWHLSTIQLQDQITASVDGTTKVFISYSWDTSDHKDWVKQLAASLRQDGVDATLDQWEVEPGDRLPAFMETGVRNHDFVIIICTPKYRERSDARRGGVGYEGDIITGEIMSKGNERKFIPVLRSGTTENAIPSSLQGKAHIDLSGNPYDKAQYSELVATLLGRRDQAPPLGNPRMDDDPF